MTAKGAAAWAKMLASSRSGYELALADFTTDGALLLSRSLDWLLAGLMRLCELPDRLRAKYEPSG